ncbi:MAG: hypothetical protein KAR06_04365 [Deltaproteobacteria bacterium]|nr:hypothetical protein [Deltaproteobacteria bacterium]
MADIITGNVDGVQAPGRLSGEPYYIENYLDFSVIGCGIADTVQALRIGVDALVENVRIDVLTAEGSAGNTDVGDGDTVDGWDADVDINATGLTKGDGAYVDGKIYAAEDTIDLTPSIALDTAVIHISALVTPLERRSA